MRSFFLGKGVPVHIKEMQVSQSLKNVTGGLGGNGEVAAEPAVHNPFGHSSARHFSTLQHEQRSQLTKRKHPLTMHSGIQSAPPLRVRRVGSRVGSRERGNFSGVGCPPSCLHQSRNNDLLLSWLPVVCPVGRPRAGYRTPCAPPALS